MTFTIREPEVIPQLEAWPARLDHLSSTSMRMFKRCPEQYRRRYILGERAAPSANAVWGKADHAGIAHNLSQKVETSLNVTLDEVLDAASDSWIAEVEAEGGVQELDWGRYAEDLGDTPAKGDLELLDTRLRNEMIRLVGLYHDQVGQHIQPQAVEQKFEIPIPGLPVPLIGYIDVVEAAQIRERKTASRTDRLIKGDWASQGRAYQLFTPLPVSWDVSLKQTQPKVREALYTLPYRPEIATAAEAAIIMTASSIVHMLADYGEDQPWPDALEHSWACNYCGWGPQAANVCYWHTGKVA